jgi:FkbM family methyltransferase
MKWYNTETGRAALGVYQGIKRVVLRALYNGLGLTRAYGLTIRPHTTDLWTVMETFERQVYLPLCSRPAAEVIVDLGANIGDAAVFFARRYPRAIIIAVECDDANFQLLLNNVKPYTNVIPVKAAIWGETQKLSVESGAGENAVYVSAQQSVESSKSVDSLTLQALMKAHHIDKIDILKIDIEGAEKNLFEQDCSWLAVVQTIGIEFHEWRIKGCTSIFFAALAKYFDGNFTLSQHGETVVIKRVLCLNPKEICE